MIYTLAIDGDETQLISFDAVLNYNEKWSGKVTEYETEFGFPINDNIVFGNPKFTLNAVLSMYVDDDVLIQFDGTDFYSDTEDDLPTITHLENKVRDIFTNKKSFTLHRSTDKLNPFSTSERALENCVLSDLSFAYDSEQYGAVYPVMEITQLNLVRVEEVENLNASPQLIPQVKVASASKASSSKKDAENGASPTGKTTISDITKPEETKVQAWEKVARQNDAYAEQQVQNQVTITKQQTYVAERMGSMKGHYEVVGGKMIYFPPSR